MRDDMYENVINPFDPDWYQQAFDKFISSADHWMNQNLIMEDGFSVPDPDGSRSSIFRNHAVFNNSFNEQVLRETLKDIYLNNSHRLAAANNDNVKFFSWFGKMSDMKYIPPTNVCEFRIPWDVWINPKDRDNFKMSQFYRQWIKVDDILLNWDIFKWHIMLFINQRIYSEYEIYIDEQEVIVRFQYLDFWVKQDFPVYIYKLDTNFQFRIRITQELCNNQWKWKVPLNVINDKRITSHTQCILAFNKVSRPDVRGDGQTRVEVLGDNLEFVEIKDGFIDISNISKFNRGYIMSEMREWLTMTIIIPKWFHEYPILLPTDVIHRPYQPELKPVVILRRETPVFVKALAEDGEARQVYADKEGKISDPHDGWKHLIRPIVLSDAFEDPRFEPFDTLFQEFRDLRDRHVVAANKSKSFEMFIRNEFVTDENMKKELDALIEAMENLRNCYNGFYDKRLADRDGYFNNIYEKQFLVAIEDIKSHGEMSDFLTPSVDASMETSYINLLAILVMRGSKILEGQPEDCELPEDTYVPADYREAVREAIEKLENKEEVYEIPDLSLWRVDLKLINTTLITIVQEVLRRFYYIEILRNLRRRHLWTDPDEFLGQVRFQRPIDARNFWMFELDPRRETWRPVELSIDRRFPDVYLATDPKEEIPSYNRIFKAFFFYSDTMNVLEESNGIIRDTPFWDEKVIEHHFEPHAIYRDIFIEKFYWMGIRAIYEGMLLTQTRWEVLEYIIDNSSYERFNNLFLQTMDPYFKLGLSTYLKSANYNFPFDDAIDKFKEAVTANWKEYNRVTNFEVYLNKQWIPSYFDYITRILDEWNWEHRLHKRPNPTFELRRLIPIIKNAQIEITDATRQAIDDLKWVLEQLGKECYNLDIPGIEKLLGIILATLRNMECILEAIDELDMQIYSIDDVNDIIALLKAHGNLIVDMYAQMSYVIENTDLNNIHEFKRDRIEKMIALAHLLKENIDAIIASIMEFDMDRFMKACNNLDTYKNARKINPDDHSAIGQVNWFLTPWPDSVKEPRNTLFVSTAIMFGTYNINKSYTDEEVEEFIQVVDRVKENVNTFRKSIEFLWMNKEYEEDQDLIDALDEVEYLIDQFHAYIVRYYAARNALVERLGNIYELINELKARYLGKTELGYVDELYSSMTSLLASLSYIAGTHRIEEAMKHQRNIVRVLTELWIPFLDHEEKVFNTLLGVIQKPSVYIDTLNLNQLLIIPLIEYMNTVNIPFIPDTGWPTYSEVFEIEEVEIFNKGFRYRVDETAFVPMIGTYIVTEVEGEITQVTSIEPKTYRTTTFRDPLIQHGAYHSISDGIGAGLMVLPKTTIRRPIKNDTIIIPLITRINNVLKSIARFLRTPNPHSNIEYNIILNSIVLVQRDWKDLAEKFDDYITYETNVMMTNLANDLQTLLEPSKNFIELRYILNLTEFSIQFEKLIYEVYKYANKIDFEDDEFFYYEAIIRTTFNTLGVYIGTGTHWNNTDRLLVVLEEVREAIWIYNKYIIPRFPEDEKMPNFIEQVEELDQWIYRMNNAIADLPRHIAPVDRIVNNLQVSMMNIHVGELPREVWYRINNVVPGFRGEGYEIGDIIQMVPELPTDHEGDVVTDQEDIIMNDVLLFQILNVEDGKVMKLEPMMDYALPYHLHGIRETITRTGEGTGLIIDTFSDEIDWQHSTLMESDDSFIPLRPQFDKNDLFKFKFENVHDLDINYEVFLAGKPVSFFQRHETIEDEPLHPNKVDVIYINANDTLDLKNSSIFIPAEQYFVYKIDNIEIKDPGAGYAVGQDIYVDVDQYCLRLRVAELVYSPYKGLAEVEPISGNLIFRGASPDGTDSRVADDTLNNIDDEYHVSYYDRLTQAGEYKAATLTFPQERYEHHTRRYDDMDGDNRNTIFMYPNVKMPLTDPPVDSGDPDYHWYQGSRIDNSQHPVRVWSVKNLEFNRRELGAAGGPVRAHTDLNLLDLDGVYMEDDRWYGIMNLNPPTNPFIPDDRRLPPELPPRGEYQMFRQMRFHTNIRDLHESMTLRVEPQLLSPAGGQVTAFIDYNIHRNDDMSMKASPVWLPPEGGNVTIAVDFNVSSVDAGDPEFTVPTFADLPRHISEWPIGAVGKTVIVEADETRGGHRTLYRVRTFLAAGFFVYNWPSLADESWNFIRVDWMHQDWHPEIPNLKQMYPGDHWRTAKRFRDIQEMISDETQLPVNKPIKINNTTYIHDVSVDDISVFNWTTKVWEDLKDQTRWRFEQFNDPKNRDWGFKLTFLGLGPYSYDMKLYLNKIPTTQIRNAALKRNAIMDVTSVIVDEINTKAVRRHVNTGRHVRIRKLFPYEQKETYRIGFEEDGEPLGCEMNFKLADYIHFKNEINLADIKVYNITAGRFENVLDPRLFRVQFKDPRLVDRGYETNTRVVRAMLGDSGQGFTHGFVWGWNPQTGIHIFGKITATVGGLGQILTFEVTHCPNPPKQNIALEFDLYQRMDQTQFHRGRVIVEFKTEDIEVYGDGYTSGVYNPMAPVPEEFKVSVLYELDGPYEYEISISKTPKNFSFIDPNWILTPTIHLPNVNIPLNRLYLMTDRGRFPLVNPSTGLPSLHAIEKEDGTDVIFFNLYRRFEHLEIRSTPYPMRSVYVQRRIPKHGYLNLQGRLNKPLNKKYFEFWMNGKLLHDEVTIISPTKLILHGLQSLRNFEIIEVNRDQNEYFSDVFLETKFTVSTHRPYPYWNYETYLDDVLTGNLKENNYNLEEQEYLLAPVWRQVGIEHPSFKDFPPNVDLEDDVIMRIHTHDDISVIGMPDTSISFMMADVPTIEGIPVTGWGLRFSTFGFHPVSNARIVELLNEEWEEELATDPYLLEFIIIDDDEWYGTTARLYDEYGILVHNLNESVYTVHDFNLLTINSTDKFSRIHKRKMVYDLN